MQQKETVKPNAEFPLQKMGVGVSLAIFGTASILLVLETKFLIPALSQATGMELCFPVRKLPLGNGLGFYMV